MVWALWNRTGRKKMKRNVIRETKTNSTGGCGRRKERGKEGEGEGEMGKPNMRKPAVSGADHTETNDPHEMLMHMHADWQLCLRGSQKLRLGKLLCSPERIGGRAVYRSAYHGIGCVWAAHRVSEIKVKGRKK
jgi:hypothetical protein